jgi:hypothetical protein
MTLTEDVYAITCCAGIILIGVYVLPFVELCVHANWSTLTITNPTPAMIAFYATIPVFVFVIAIVVLFNVIALKMIGG